MLNMRLKLVAVCLLALFMLSVGSGVSCATLSLYDDDETWWSVSGCTATEITTGQYYGTSALQVVTTGGVQNGVIHTYGAAQDFSSYDKISFYFKGQNTAATFYIKFCIAGWAGEYSRQFTDNSSSWQLFTYLKSDFTDTSGNWSAVRYIFIYGATTTQTFYLDYLWLSSNNSQTLTVNDPVNCVVSPANASYVEGQPVKVTASGITTNYVFKSFNWTTSSLGVNPAWVLMTENQTLICNLWAPVYLTICDPFPPITGIISPFVGTSQRYYGEWVTVSVTPFSGYTFGKWTVLGYADLTYNPATIIMTQNYSVTSVLVQDNFSEELLLVSLYVIVVTIFLSLSLIGFKMKSPYNILFAFMPLFGLIFVIIEGTFIQQYMWYIQWSLGFVFGFLFIMLALRTTVSYSGKSGGGSWRQR